MNIEHGDTAQYLDALHGRANYQVSAIYQVEGKPKLVLVGTFNSAHAAAAAAEPHDAKAQGLYVSINRLARWATNPAKLANKDHATDKDYSARKHFYFDFDSRRPDGVNATELELSAALKTRDECAEWLTGMGWPGPKVIGMSGNGGTLIYRLADGASDSLYTRAHAATCDHFNDKGALLDASVTDRRRITPLFGTTKRKGEHTRTRPQRVASAEVNTDAQPVTAELLAVLAELWTPKEQPQTAQLVDYGGEQLPAAVVEFLSNPPTEGTHKRNRMLYAAARAMRDANMTEAHALGILTPAAITIGLDAREARATIASPFKHPRTHTNTQREQVQAWVMSMQQRSWTGRNGASRYKAALAVGTMANKIGRDEVNASGRDVAVIAGMSQPVTARALRGLCLVDRVLKCTNLRKRDTGHARRYKLIGGMSVNDSCNARRCTPPTPSAMHESFTDNSHDAFNTRAGGGALAQIIAALIEREALSITQLASITGRHRETLARVLRMFESAGGVIRDGRVWRLRATNEGELLAALDRLALVCKVTGRNDKRRAVYAAEQEDFKTVKEHNDDPVAVCDRIRARRIKMQADAQALRRGRYRPIVRKRKSVATTAKDRTT